MSDTTTSTPYVAALQTFYNNVSKSYDSTTSSMHGEGPQNLVTAAGSHIAPGKWVLDLATGTGKVALIAAEKVGPEGKVLGIDISDKFLEHARSKAEGLGFSERTEFREGDVAFLHLPEEYEGKKFDAITVGSAISMFEDPKAMLDTLATNFLKPDGVFVADTQGPNILAKLFLDVAVPMGFTPPFDPRWLSDIPGSLHRVFENTPLEVNEEISHATGAMKWDFSSREKVDAMWSSLVEQQVWVSFGVDKLPAGKLDEIKEACVKEIENLKNKEDLIENKISQYIVVAGLKDG